MSRENVEIVRSCLAARWSGGDYAGARDLIDPRVVVDLSARPDGRVYTGWAEAARALQDWVDRWDDYSYEAEQFLEAGDQVVVLFRESGRGRESGVFTEFLGATVWTLEGGKVVRTKTYADRREALAETGLRIADPSREAAARPPRPTEVIRRACEAWGSGDISSYREMYAPDVTAHAGELAPEMAGDIHGPEPIIRVLESLMESFDHSDLIPGEFIERGDVVVVPILMRAQPHGTAKTIEWKTWVFYRFRDGLIVHQGWYPERADALRAAGLEGT